MAQYTYTMQCLGSVYLQYFVLCSALAQYTYNSMQCLGSVYLQYSVLCSALAQCTYNILFYAVPWLSVLTIFCSMQCLGSVYLQYSVLCSTLAQCTYNILFYAVPWLSILTIFCSMQCLGSVYLLAGRDLYFPGSRWQVCELFSCYNCNTSANLCSFHHLDT